MSRRKRGARYGELTSLLDVLFIVLFASLIQAAAVAEGAGEEAREAAAEEAGEVTEDAEADAPGDAGVPDAATADAASAPAADHEELRARALDALLEELGARTAAFARISEAGVVEAVEVDRGGIIERVEVGTPLLERVADADVETAYIGDRTPELRVCAIVRVTLGLEDLDGHIVVIVPERPLTELRTSLVEGLTRDQERCFADEGAVGILVSSYE